jgi:hypothetical protein
MHIGCYELGGLYFIGIIYNNVLYYDDDIADLLNIDFREFIKFTKEFSSFNSQKLTFENKENCQKCYNYIKEKFNDRLVYLTLTEI